MPLARKHQQMPLDFSTMKAGEITTAILAYLSAHGYSVWRQNTSGIYHPATGRWRVNPQGRRGVADIIGFRRADGRFIAIEVKAGSDQLRPEQVQFLNELKAAGGIAFVAYDYAHFLQSFERRGLHKISATPTPPATP